MALYTNRYAIHPVSDCGLNLFNISFFKVYTKKQYLAYLDSVGLDHCSMFDNDYGEHPFKVLQVNGQASDEQLYMIEMFGDEIPELGNTFIGFKTREFLLEESRIEGMLENQYQLRYRMVDALELLINNQRFVFLESELEEISDNYQHAQVD